MKDMEVLWCGITPCLALARIACQTPNGKSVPNGEYRRRIRFWGWLWETRLTLRGGDKARVSIWTWDLDMVMRELGGG